MTSSTLKGLESMLWELLITLNDPPSPVDQTNLEEGPPREHIFYQPPSARAESLNTIHSQLEELDKALEKVRDLKKKVLEAEKQIIRNIGQVHQLTSPIGSLPNELLHEIFFCVVSGSRDYLAIQSLSAVCQRWRTYMFGQTQWFSDANWDEWPPSLIIEWCGRTGSHPLTIRLTEPGLKRISTPCSSRCSCVPANGDVCFLSTLKGCMEKCCELHVETERRDAETFDARNHVLFAPYRPSLHSLSYSVDNVDPVSGAREFDYEAERFPIPWVSFAINAPNLRILRLHGVIITSDLVSLEDLSLDLNYNPERSDYQQLRRYYRFDLLKKLTLCNWGLHLPKFFNPDDMSSLQSFGLVDSPFKSLREVFVNKDIACLTLQEVCFADTLPNLSDLETIDGIAPCLMRLRLNFFWGGLRDVWLGACTSLLHFLTNQPQVLPGLQELEIHVSAQDVVQWLMRVQLDGFSLAMKELVSSRAMKRIGLPYIPVQLETMARALNGGVDVWETEPLDYDVGVGCFGSYE